MGEVLWSRILQESMDIILLLRVLLSRKKLARFSNRYITRLKRRVDIQKSLHPSILQVKNHLTNAYCWYYKFKKYALNLIDSWIRYFADQKAKEKGIHQYGVYKSLVTWEKQRREG